MRNENRTSRIPRVPYVYPDVLRQSIEHLPSVPGVYFFYGESDTLPLYIGKSVNIRSRVLAHLRNPAEAALLSQSRKVTFQPTAGELGALLLEAHLIKRLTPLFNKRLRKLRQLYTLRLTEGNIAVVALRETEFGRTPNIYGLYKNSHLAKEALKHIADEHRLCYSLLGLEKLPRNRPCFRYTLNKCSGACCGEISLSEHRSRLLIALKSIEVLCWPWQGRIAVYEQSDTGQCYHIIHNWAWLGDVDSLENAAELTSVSDGYDIDSYKILAKLLFSGDYQIIELDSGGI